MVNASFISRLSRAVDLIAQRGQARTPKVVKVRKGFAVDHPDAARDGYAARVIFKLRLLARAEVFLVLLAAVLVGSQFPALAQADAWTLLRERGHVVFMRHAATSGGSGDPPSYRLDDCASQRNLTDAGRAQARRTGEAFRTRGLAFDRVMSSPWCRCMETAKLLTGRDAQPMEALSNLVGRTEHRDRQVAALKAYLAGLGSDTRVLFSTHGIVISALVGINPAEGEMVIVKLGPGGEPSVAGRLRVE